MATLTDESIGSMWGYTPNVAAIHDLITEHAFQHVLVVGEDVPDCQASVPFSRYVSTDVPELPLGCYWSHLSGRSVITLVTEGRTPVPPQRVRSDDLSDEHPLALVADWHEALWDRALPVPHALFGLGDEVLTRPGGQDGRVKGRSFQDGRWSYRVLVAGIVRIYGEANLEATPDFSDPRDWANGEAATAQRFSATLTRAKLNGGLSDTVFSFRATKTIFRPYQFKPVMRLLEAAKPRLLVADEVGLGKTIEAGLIWTELEARGLANKVLVVCPSSLVGKWKREMEQRFSFELQELDSDGLDEFARRLEAGQSRQRSAYICSLERLRSWKLLDDVAELGPRFDLVIVDEAHALRNRETRSHTLGLLLDNWSDALVFLSATPLNLRSQDLFNLLQLLVPGEFDSQESLDERLEPNGLLHRLTSSLFNPAVTPENRIAWLDQIGELTYGQPMLDRPEFAQLLDVASRPSLSGADVVQIKRLATSLHSLSAVVTRTRKVEIQEDKAMRSPTSIEVVWGEAEEAFYAEYLEWCRLRAAVSGTAMKFSMQMPLRLAGSCLPVAAHQVLTWAGEDPDHDDEDSPRPEDSTKDARPPQLPPPASLVEAAEALGTTDSKFDLLEPKVHELVGMGKRLIVFTYSRLALGYLKQRLRGSFRVEIMHGGVSKDARAKLMVRFRAGEFDVLLANRVASEGLDFEFCSAVINWDLPWNPMEIEQRIGRIDRIGQLEKKIYIINFHNSQTIEQEIIHRVMLRIGVFERSIGELEPILMGQVADLEGLLFDFSLTAEQRERKAAEVLAAIEEKALAKAELESASPALLSSDNADIEGFENGLMSSGRYVGQHELVVLLSDWINSVGRGRLTVSHDRDSLTINGTAAMADDVQELVRRGERMQHEVAGMKSLLRDEADIVLSLNSEKARTGSLPLLTANHPLVRGALRVPGHRQARFARLRIDAPDGVKRGRYLVLVAMARWDGLRPAREVWTSVVDLETGLTGPDSVGDAVLAGLASAAIREGLEGPCDLLPAVDKAERLLMRRRGQEEIRRDGENASLLAARRISLHETHERKCRMLEEHIQNFDMNGQVGPARMFRGQLRKANESHEENLRAIEKLADCSLDVEPLAVCSLEAM